MVIANGWVVEIGSWTTSWRALNSKKHHNTQDSLWHEQWGPSDPADSSCFSWCQLNRNLNIRWSFTLRSIPSYLSRLLAWLTGTQRRVGTRQYRGCKRWELNELLFAKNSICVWEELFLSLGQVSYLFLLFLQSGHTHAGSCSQCYLDRCNYLLSDLI